MIVFGTLAVALVAVLFFIALPAFSLMRAEAKTGNPSPEEIAAAVSAKDEGLSLSDYSFALSGDLYDLSYTVSVSAIPPFLKSYIDNNYGTDYTNLSVYFNIVFNDLSVLAPIYSRYNLWPPKTDPETATESLTFVSELRNTDLVDSAGSINRRTQIGTTNPMYAANANTLYFYLDEGELSTSITLLKLPQYAIIPYEADGEIQPSLALQFARDVVAEANRRAEEALLPFMESIAVDPLASPPAVSAAESFVRGYSSFFTLYEVPAMLPSESERSQAVPVALAALLGLFVFVFAAFCRNSLLRVKQDERSMRLLEDAWKGGKRV